MMQSVLLADKNIITDEIGRDRKSNEHGKYFWFFSWSKDAMQQPNRVIPKREKGGTEQSTR